MQKQRKTQRYKHKHKYWLKNKSRTRSKCAKQKTNHSKHAWETQTQIRGRHIRAAINTVSNVQVQTHRLLYMFLDTRDWIRLTDFFLLPVVRSSANAVDDFLLLPEKEEKQVLIRKGSQELFWRQICCVGSCFPLVLHLAHRLRWLAQEPRKYILMWSQIHFCLIHII